MAHSVMYEALVRRYPDVMWTARTRDGTRRVLILTEFQGQQDRLMPLRTTIYSHLALEELLRRTQPAPSPDSTDVLRPMVIYHGPGAWRGPTSLDELFPHGIPREFRVIFRDSETGGSGAAVDLVGAIASLDIGSDRWRERSPRWAGCGASPSGPTTGWTGFWPTAPGRG